MSAAELNTGGVYLKTWLEPFRPFLDDEAITEILVNRPGEVWTEVSGKSEMQRHLRPDIDDLLLSRLAAQIARTTHQAISREAPLLAATLPDGARVQIIAPPAAAHWTLAIRRHRMRDLDLSAWDMGPLRPAQARAATDQAEAARRDPIGFLKAAVAARQTVLISGGTSSGKTTFLNALLKCVPDDERLILVEDTPEVAAPHSNRVRLVAVKGDQGEARIGIDDLLQAALRLRPDRLIVGEVRGPEAVTFLRAINTGHPGSFTTIHANSCDGAMEQLALMVLQSGANLSRGETLAYAASLIDVVVQLSRQGGQRRITDISFPRLGASQRAGA